MATHPHNTPQGANDTGLPSRRSLGRLLAAGAAMALPAMPALASAPALNSELLRLANRVERLARIENGLLLRCATLDDAIVDPPRPEKPAFSGMTSAGWSANGLEFRATYDRPFYESGPEWKLYEAAVEERERECVRRREAARLPALEARRDLMLERLVEATNALTALPCTSVADLSAKARAWLAIDEGGSRDDWTEALALSIVTKLASFGDRAGA